MAAVSKVEELEKEKAKEELLLPQSSVMKVKSSSLLLLCSRLTSDV